MTLLRSHRGRLNGSDRERRNAGLCFEHVLYPWRHAFFVFITSERSVRICFLALNSILAFWTWLARSLAETSRRRWARIPGVCDPESAGMRIRRKFLAGQQRALQT